MKIRPIVYVCSPLRGDIERNITRAVRYSRFVYTKGAMPLAPHTIFTQFLDDNIEEERNAGRQMGIELLMKCDELWAFGKKASEGMALEMAAAKALGLKVRRFDEKGEPLDE